MEKLTNGVPVFGEPVQPDQSNIVDLRNRGICEDCQEKVVEALTGKKTEMVPYVPSPEYESLNHIFDMLEEIRKGESTRGFSVPKALHKIIQEINGIKATLGIYEP